MISHIHANNALSSVLPTATRPSPNTATSSSGSASTSSTSSSTSSNTSSATTDIGSTFLNLLVQELQNQDPTAPMDSTAMVGQMISLNQLDQLISINQAVTGTAGSTASGTTSAATGSIRPTSTSGAALSSLGAPVADAIPTASSQPLSAR